MELLWQLIGFGGMVCIMLSFQIKSPKGLIFMQCVAQIMFVVHYTMIGSPAGAIQNGIAVFRALLLMSGNKAATSKWAKYIVMAMFLFSPLLVYESFIDLLPGIAMTVNTYYIWSMNSKHVRMSQLTFISPLWIAYNVANVSYSGVFTEIFNMISSAIFLVRLKLEKRKAKNEGL